MTVVCLNVLAEASAPGLPELPATVPGRLRARDSQARSLTEEAFGRSPTIRQIGLALERTDVIVYIAMSSRDCRAHPTTTLLASGEGTRYVSITLPTTTCGCLSRSDRPVGTPALIAWLGHELHHALEIAAEPEVRDQDGVRRLYCRIGSWRADYHGYETAAALEAQQAIARELSRR